MGRANRKQTGGGNGARNSGWRSRFLDVSKELAPDFEGHERLADQAAVFYDLPEREQEGIVARTIKEGYKANPNHGDRFSISDNGKIYGEVVLEEKDGTPKERASVLVWEDRHPESDQIIAEATAPPFVETHVAKTVRERMLGAADYISKDPGEESFFEFVDSKKEWEKRRDEGTLNPDKVTAIRISEEEYKKVEEDAERARQGLPPIHATPPRPGDTPPWNR